MKVLTVRTCKRISNSLMGKQFSQSELVLAILQHNVSVTSKQLMAAGVTNPSLIVSYLRSVGFDIRTTLVEGRNSNGIIRRNIAEYSLLLSKTDHGGE